MIARRGLSSAERGVTVRRNSVPASLAARRPGARRGRGGVPLIRTPRTLPRVLAPAEVDALRTRRDRPWSMRWCWAVCAAAKCSACVWRTSAPVSGGCSWPRGRDQPGYPARGQRLVPAPDRRRVHPERRCDLRLARGAQPHQLNGSPASMQAAGWSRVRVVPFQVQVSLNRAVLPGPGSRTAVAGGRQNPEPRPRCPEPAGPSSTTLSGRSRRVGDFRLHA
jgi:hypothetical protein